MSNLSQFDTILGGLVNVPPSINIFEFASSRKEEIIMLNDVIQESPFKGQVFQRLPKHMRRRQMSHHMKRLPRKYWHTHPTKAAEGTVSKRPSRKFRRRPRNLLLEYNRRQRNGVWLETHIWHAKRFHMVHKWGYKLADKPVNKGFRATYRAASEHCLLVDMSYYNCVQLSGTLETLLFSLQQCVSTECGLTFAAKAYLKGTKEGCVPFYHPRRYPLGFIGNVQFMWRPKDATRSVIWLWVHTAIHTELVECLSKLFHIEEELTVLEQVVNGAEQTKLEPKNVPFGRTPKYKNAEVEMIILKDTLNRFRITGPLSQATLGSSFTVAPVQEEQEDAEVMVVAKVEEWWLPWYRDAQQLHRWHQQKLLYDSLNKYADPSQMMPSMVCSVVVADPRLSMPPRRTKIRPVCQDVPLGLHQLNDMVAHSPLWECSIRDEVTQTKLATAQINQARTAVIVPGESIGFGRSRVPVMMIHRPGSQDSSTGRLGFGSGWDVITPSGWGLPVWRSLVWRGGRAGGLRDTSAISLEGGSLSDTLQPDSVAGQAEALERYSYLRSKYLKLPPNKRANYNKLSSHSPFFCPWMVLIRDWALDKNLNEFYVLRNMKRLQELNTVIRGLKRSRGNVINMLERDKNCLVPVSLTLVGKGRPSELAMICLPTEDDCRVWKSTGSSPVQPIQKDENENRRKELKAKHQKVLKHNKRRRKGVSKKLAEEINKQALGVKVKSKKLKQKTNVPTCSYASDMAELWVKSIHKVDTVSHTSSRAVLGYLVKGDFSFCKANGFGLGFVAFPALLTLVQQCQKTSSENFVLVRNANQLQYRFARIEILYN